MNSNNTSPKRKTRTARRSTRTEQATVIVPSSLTAAYAAGLVNEQAARGFITYMVPQADGSVLVANKK